MTMNKGMLFVISGPAGVGKGTVAKLLVKQHPDLTLSVSATTRAPRPNEHEGEHYYFVCHETFSDMIDKGLLLEYNCYNGNYYGTPRDAVEKAMNTGSAVILEIDVHGGFNARKAFPDGRVVLIFLDAPSTEEHEKRLRGRGTEDDETIARRLAIAAEERACKKDYDYVVVNDNIDRAVSEIYAIIRHSLDSISQ
jgi:guanylate kinase